MGKRAAPSPAGGSRKRTNADPVAPKVKEVEKAIKKAEALPEHCKEMLENMAGSSLSVLAAERHPYQNQAVKMLGETVAAVHTQMKNAVSEAQGKVDNADREKASRAAALDAATQNQAALEQKCAAAKDAVETSKAAVATSKANLASAQAAVDGKDAEVKDTSELKTKLESALGAEWETSKTSKTTAKALHTLEKLFTEIGLEAGLIDSLPDTLKKDPEARGTFDGIVTKHVDEATAKYLVTTTATIQNAEQAKVDLANAKAAAEAALTAADEKSTASAFAFSAAETAVKDGKAALKQANSAVENFEKEMSTAGSSLEHAKEALTAFADGAVASFAALKDLAPPPEPEPEAAEVTEAAAAAPAAQPAAA